MLNIPVVVSQRIEKANNILIIGAGDILCGLPLYYTFLKQGKKVHLANLSNTDFKTINAHADPIILEPNLFGANSVIKNPSENYMEGYLSLYFKAALKEDKIVWMFNKVSVLEFKKALERLIEHLKVDFVFFVDGGTDSIMIGDEGRDALTPKFVDTTLMLAAIQQMEDFHNKFFWVAINNNLTDSNIINKNISNLSSQVGFFGGCYIIDFMNSYKFMKSGYIYEKNNNNSLPNLEYLVKITDSDYEEGEGKMGLPQFLFFNPVALAYNNIVIHKILEAPSHYDIVQIIAPVINKAG